MSGERSPISIRAHVQRIEELTTALEDLIDKSKFVAKLGLHICSNTSPWFLPFDWRDRNIAAERITLERTFDYTPRILRRGSVRVLDFWLKVTWVDDATKRFYEHRVHVVAPVKLVNNCTDEHFEGWLHP